MGAPLRIYPVEGLPEIHAGDDLGKLLAVALEAGGLAPEPGAVLVVAHKVVSKAEGASVRLETVTPSPFAVQWAERWERDPRLVELVLSQSKRIVRMDRGLIVAETHHGFVCANAGVDLSNSGGEGTAILLPEDPDRSAQELRARLKELTGQEVGVIVADTFGRPWRVGLTQVALGVAGLAPLIDLRGQEDGEGRLLHMTVIAAADELACAADLVCGKFNRVPAALILGYSGPAGEGRGTELVREPGMDLFR
ncbi:MAG: coenzyme F420-0:L-glutamate ligase [SAR324 cluster bacterium]|nr:coenzyme F420-0:L-glutamate ligase [SAR324 cluster bacterium]